MTNSRAGVTLKKGILQQAQEKKQIPLIMYDYVNTGINQKLDSPKATLKTIINNGEAVLNYALSNFEKVHIYGDGLGYKVAAVSLQRYLQENKNINKSRLQFYNVNNADANSRELLANYPKKLTGVLRYIGGLNMNAQSAIEDLVDSGVKITEQVNQ
jgi:hypothetical protein